MRNVKSAILPVILATVWISLSEFLRNEVLFRDLWITHYDSLGLVFPADPINGAIWGLWSFLFAGVIYILSWRFNLWETTFLSWFVAFIMMWVVIGNLDVLPFALLPYAIPLSWMEAFLAAWIIRKFIPKNTK
jgi:hypothetical protein